MTRRIMLTKTTRLCDDWGSCLNGGNRLVRQDSDFADDTFVINIPEEFVSIDGVRREKIDCAMK